MMLLDILLLAAGLALLYYGAEWLVKGAASLAHSLGVATVVIGLTIVAFGTSMPEMVVSMIASYQKKSMISIGNVVGSNICNIALILGLAAAIRPLSSHPVMVRRDLPIMMGVSSLIFLMSWNSMISRLEGVILFGGIILFTFFSYALASRKAPLQAGAAGNNGESGTGGATEMEKPKYEVSRIKQVILILVGLAAVIGGAEILVDAAIKLMRVLGVSEKFIGLTIVAVGTSLPELATSVIAAIRKEMDISIGNIVGSNIFNILCVLGAAALIRPIPMVGGFFGSGLVYDYLVMIVVALLLWLMMRKKNALSRADGFVLLSIYAAYIVWLSIKE
jgi:cation:H+ antiporter